MGVTITFSTGEQAPGALAELMVSKFGIDAALAACGREIFIAETMKRADDLRYWAKVGTEVAHIAGKSACEKVDTVIHASAEEGLSLNSIFARIADQSARRKLLELAVMYLRQDPIG